MKSNLNDIQFRICCRAKIPVWIERGSLALPPPDVPLICVGPGTGVAPFRSFMHERAALLRSGATVAPSILLFGCRNEAKDSLYTDVHFPSPFDSDPSCIDF
jgi:sulfite reductase alpha subunit-like flavoprotein